MTTGRVYLVGAGCGGRELLTCRGRELLENCGAAVYDDLLDPALLDLLPPEAERIYAGKRRGRHSAGQEEISRTLIDLARAGKTVVRLKGGDPFVFGRGGEEMLALQAAGVPCEAVPGVSSAIAVPELAGIPVTHRGVSRSFHVITAHTADTADGLPENLEVLARLEGTLVFLMGLSQLPGLSEKLLAAGMDPGTPAAVARRSGAVRGTLADIARRAADIPPPAVIVIGPAAAMDLSPRRGLPLEGVTVGLTGTAGFAERLRTMLESLGAGTAVLERPVIRPLPFSPEILTRGPCWAVFTSANGAEVWCRRLREARFDLRRLSRCRFAVIGPATGRALEARGLFPDLCPKEYSTRALGRALLERVPAGETVYLLRSRQGDPALGEMLSARLRTEEVPLYDVEPRFLGTEERLDYLVFASAGGAERVLSAMGGIPAGCVPVCIGPVTAAALEKRYAGEALTAEEATAEALTEAIVRHREKNGC